MKRKFSPRWYVISLVVLLTLSLICFAGCTSSSSQNQNDFYNAGNANLSVTGAQFDQYLLFRFDTSSSALTLALPSAVDIVLNLSSPYAGEVITFAVTADGSNAVTLIAGTNVTIKPSASTVAGNTTLTMYCEFDNITSGSVSGHNLLVNVVNPLHMSSCHNKWLDTVPRNQVSVPPKQRMNQGQY